MHVKKEEEEIYLIGNASPHQDRSRHIVDRINEKSVTVGFLKSAQQAHQS
jgi:hypothetical protein